jgi:hypothetical protein
MKYYLLLNGEIKGPIQIMTVREMLSAGAIQESTLMAQEGADGWQPAATVLAQVADPDHSGMQDDRESNISARRPTTPCTWAQRPYVKVAAFFVVVLVILAYLGGAKAKKGDSVKTSREHAEGRSGDTEENISTINSKRISIESEFHIVLDKGLYMGYYMTYEVGKKANKRMTNADYDLFVNDLRQRHPRQDINSIQFLIMGMADGNLSRPNRLEGIAFDSLPAGENAE